MAGSGPGKFAEFGGSEGAAPRGYLLYNFDPGKADLKPEHQEALTRVPVGILSGGRSRVQLIGRAARSESPGADIGISMERAEAVQRYLTAGISKFGGDKGRIQVQARGEPFGFPNGDEEDRSVVILPILPPDFVVGFHVSTSAKGVNWPVVQQVVSDALGPSASEAKRPLKISTSTNAAGEDVAVNFVDGNATVEPCKSTFIILGMDGAGSVFVNTFLKLRLCLANAPGPPLFKAADRELAQAVGNTAAHEIGHRLMGPDHSSEVTNFMYEGVKGGGQPSPALRSREAALSTLAGKKLWSDGQRALLRQAIATGNYRGGMR